MKKFLLGASALALSTAFATTSFAADTDGPELSVGGFFYGGMSYVDSDKIDGVFDVKGDNVLKFKGKVPFDNGMTAGTEVRLYAGGSSGTADSAFVNRWNVSLAGVFGQVILGADNNAAKRLAVDEAPYYGGDVFWGGYVDAPGGDYLNLPAEHDATGSHFPSISTISKSRAEGITYLTPEMGGFTLGITYQTAGPRNEAAEPENNDGFLVSGGARYQNNLGPVAVKVSAGYGSYDNEPETNGYRGGLSVGYQGFTVSGGYGGNQDIDTEGNKDRAWEAGIGYETGPYGVAFGYHGAIQKNSAAKDTELQLFQVNGGYELIDGVTWGAGVSWAQVKDGYRTEGEGDSAKSVQVAGKEDGWGVETGLTLTF